MDEQTFSRVSLTLHFSLLCKSQCIVAVVQVVMEGMASVGREMFDSVVEYLCECGEERRRRRGWEEWRYIRGEKNEPSHCII